MTQLFANNAQSLLTQSVQSTDTILNIVGVDESLFPIPGNNEFFMVTLQDDQGNIEICRCYQRVGSALEVERGQEGTTPIDFPQSSIVELRLTRETLERFIQDTGDTMKGDLYLDGNRLHGGIVEDVTIRNAHIMRSTQSDMPGDIPIGSIIMWAGDVTNIPPGWALCDGNTTGVPDLRDRFIVGAGGTYDVGDAGGKKDYTTTSDGAHAHSNKTGEHVLTKAELPDVPVQIGAQPNYGTTQPKPAPDENSIASLGYGMRTYNSSPMGDGKSHSHRISSQPAHSHRVTDVQPPYFALAYIIKLPPKVT